MLKVGFVGLGIMGKPMVMNMLKAGIDVTVSDLKQELVDEVVAAGGKSAASVKELAKGKDAVFTILPTAAIVQDVLTNEDGILAGVDAGTVVVDCSSVSPIESKQCRDLAAAKDCPFLDAPVSGGEEGAINGTLAFMIGGDEKAAEKIKDAFEAMGSSWIVVGPTGSGSVTKLANQIMVNVNICAVAEALVLAQKAGADPKKVFEAVRCGLAGSTVLETKAPKMFNRDFKAGGTIKVNLKDITNVMNTARDLQVPLFLSGIVQQIQLSLKQSGHIMDDHAGYVQFYEQISGVTVKTEEK